MKVGVVFVEPKTLLFISNGKIVGSVSMHDFARGCRQIKILFCKNINCLKNYYYFKSACGTTIGLPDEFVINRIGGMFDPVLDRVETKGIQCDGLDIEIDKVSVEVQSHIYEEHIKEKEEEISTEGGEFLDSAILS
ncbi:hypothetical protein M0R36_09590 [bacterium]|nr:hypothetical protein [bacterium]